ncbi:hypothetical protein GQ600_26155 [Phytophthora cactorum]|nr:hypothetical protein GQ600_26155 [Phytophthora cactorum]
MDSRHTISHTRVPFKLSSAQEQATGGTAWTKLFSRPARHIARTLQHQRSSAEESRLRSTERRIATQLQRLSTLLFGEAVNGAYPTARLTNLSAQHQEGVPFDTCRDKVLPSPAFLYKVSEGYSILRAEVEEHFESNLPGQWKPTFDIYLKPSNNAKQKQFEVVCQETAALLAQLKDVWKRARQRHNGQAGGYCLPADWPIRWCALRVIPANLGQFLADFIRPNRTGSKLMQRIEGGHLYNTILQRRKKDQLWSSA